MFGNHTKKRPNNLILGRLYDNRVYDLLELGVEKYKSIKSFGAASSTVQTQNKVFQLPKYTFRSLNSLQTPWLFGSLLSADVSCSTRSLSSYPSLAPFDTNNP